MKPILAMAAALMLAGCASTDALVVESAAPEAESAPPPDPDSIEVAAVIELEPRTIADPEERCRQEKVVGTRITRQRCYRMLSDAEQRISDDVNRIDIESARDMAMLVEQLRIQEMSRRRQGSF